MVWTIVLAAMPDALHALFVGAWALSQGSAVDWLVYATASPGGEPPFPDWVAQGAHHLHCIAHSIPVAASITALTIALSRHFWLPLLGWWSHIAIDVFTHSAEFYPVPVFYPFTDWAFDGIAWNTPWFLVANYAVLIVFWLWLRNECTLARALAKPNEPFASKENLAKLVHASEMGNSDSVSPRHKRANSGTNASLHTTPGTKDQ